VLPLLAALVSPPLSVAVDVLVRTDSLTMRGDDEAPIDLDRGKLRFRSSTRDDAAANRIVVPPSGGTSDPTLSRATLIVESTGGSGERVVYPLPAHSWDALSHPSVDNDVALAEYEYVANKGVPTFYDEHPPSPLYAERFVRVPGVSLALSAAVAGEIEDAGFVDADGYFLVPISAIENATNANPLLMPTFSAQSATTRRRMLDQMGAMRADHQSYSDWATRTLDWFELWQP
jgi:hypothetical protein